MAKRVWTVDLPDGSHTVELEHGYWSGKRVVRVDGNIVLQTRKLLDYGSSYAIPIGSHQGVVLISTNGITFDYDLAVDGKSVRTGEEISPLRLPKTVANAEEVQSATYDLMLGQIRSWGLWQLGLGAFHLIGSGFFSAPWGLLLIAVGLTSFVFKDATMFVIYAVTLAWAGLSNLLDGASTRWSFFAILQFYLAFQVFRQFFTFNQAQQSIAALPSEPWLPPTPKARAADQVFPWTGCLLGVSSILGVLGFVAWIFGLAFTGRSITEMPSGMLDFIGGMIVNLGVLGLAISLASLLARFRYRALAVIGLISSLGVLGIWIFLVVSP